MDGNRVFMREFRFDIIAFIIENFCYMKHFETLLLL